MKEQKKSTPKKESSKKFLLFQRRKEFASLYFQGFEVSDIVRKISKKYKVKKATLIKDWERKSSWLDQLFCCSKKDAKTEVLIKLNLVEKACWETYRKAKDGGNLNAAVGVLGKLMDVIKREEDFVNNSQDVDLTKHPFLLEKSHKTSRRYKKMFQYKPHKKQLEFHNDAKKVFFRGIIAATGSGKTLCGTVEVVRWCIENPGSVGFCMSPP